MRSAQEVFAEVREAAKRPGASTATPLLPQSTLESILVADDVRATPSNERDIDTETVDFAGLGALITSEAEAPVPSPEPAALGGGDSVQVIVPEPP
jgi:hypothetical protein